MAQATRVYCITSGTHGLDEIEALVEATNQQQALSWYARRNLGCGIASPRQIIEATKKGLEIEPVKDATPAEAA